MAIVDAQRHVSPSGKVVGVTAKLRTPQRLSFGSVQNPPPSLGSGASASGDKDTAEADLDEALWAHAACQDYLFGMAVKSKFHFSLEEALEDFKRWELDVVWGADEPTRVTIVRGRTR